MGELHDLLRLQHGQKSRESTPCESICDGSSTNNTAIMADEYDAEQAAEIKKRRAFRKFSYRGIDLDKYVHHPPDTRANHHCLVERQDSRAFANAHAAFWTSAPTSSVMSSTPVPAAGSTAASSAGPWA